ncbi:MAG: DUF2231 domain-containing protein [Actinomycetota bacterium]|nr:DUF2231 domain-containing protein [Actinomycetota bacterium]
MKRFSVRPSLTIRGRKFKGLRGWAGKPFHPPLTDIPVAAYLLAAAFDVISTLGRHQRWGVEFFHAATYTVVGGAVVSVFAALTGFWDWWRSTKPGNQARRTANTHAVIMLTVTALVLVDLALRLADYHTRSSPSAVILILSLLVAALVSVGATYGGTLVFDYGFNVETAGDSPVWHTSDTDVLPGRH